MRCGQIYYNDTRIQLLDLPGIIEGAAYGRGRGREVSVPRYPNMILSSTGGFPSKGLDQPGQSWLLGAIIGVASCVFFLSCPRLCL